MSAQQRRRDQVIALAAVAEAASLVDQLARNGSAPLTDMETLAQSLFRFEWNAVDEVFGGAVTLAHGLEVLEDLLQNGTGARRGNTLRYLMAMLHLSRALRSDRAMLARIRERLAHSARNSAHFASNFDAVSTSVAAVYQSTISTYRYRIQVAGSAAHLQNGRNADRIRTLLLAGLRAAVLWRHLGGSRVRALLWREQLLVAVRALRAEASA